MSGHSKWATIKRKKGALDAKRGKIFTKIIREIVVAAKRGGGNPDSNANLRTIILKAKAVNMPADNIKRAIQKGTGELEGASYEEITYEGYGPSGIAILVDASTDNKNRTSSELRAIFSKSGGNMGEAGCVSWMFEKKGTISVTKEGIDEETLMTLVLELGADDIQAIDDNYEIITSPESFEKVRAGLEAKNIKLENAEVTMIPKNYITINNEEAEKVLSLIEALEDCDDVLNVYANFDTADNESAKE
jgi:YebC/PmpR family DNA-binding regulatory protein